MECKISKSYNDYVLRKYMELVQLNTIIKINFICFDSDQSYEHQGVRAGGTDWETGIDIYIYTIDTFCKIDS